MREFKFRVWDHIHKIMMKLSEVNTYSVIDILSNTFKESLSVMQYTGLKDKNGKEIYEGDICKVINYASDYLKIHGKMYCVISWSNTTGFYGKGFGVPTTFSIGEEFEVIGNIYENPELLEQK